MENPADKRVENLLNTLLYNHLALAALGETGFVPLGINGLVERVTEGIEVLKHYGEWFQIGVDANDLFNPDELADSAAEILGVDDRYIDLYQARFEDLLQQEDYHAASSVALLLTVLKSNDPAAWIMYGMAEQLCGRYVSSACAFTSAIHCGADEHYVMFYAAQGYVLLGKGAFAKKILDRIISLTHDDDSKKELRLTVFKMLSYL